MANIIAVVNQKGGVAKTTTAVNLACALGRRKHRVLLVDLDPQANATSGLGALEESQAKTDLFDLLIQQETAQESIFSLPNEKIDILGGSKDLSGFDTVLTDEEDRLMRLKTLLAPIESLYDFIFIDCPPSLGLLTINALVAAHTVFVPIQCEYYALEGVSQLMETIEGVRAINPSLHVGMIIMTMYDGRMRLAKQVVQDVRSAFGNVVAKTLIPRNVRLSEAPSFGKSIFTYEPFSKGAFAYKALAKEVEQIGK